jgi:class II flagellar assembly regulator FliX
MRSRGPTPCALARRRLAAGYAFLHHGEFLAFLLHADLGARHRDGAAYRAALAGSGKSCRLFLLAINHKRTHLAYYAHPYYAHPWTDRHGPRRHAKRGAAPLRRHVLPRRDCRAAAAEWAVALRTLSGIDALIALQGIEDPVERRRRAVKHGRRALDALDELKLGFLAGTLDQGTMLRLKAVAADLQEASGDDRLDSVLAEIDVRVAVELAKASVS